jgi:von Hippel-Lindau disease tumor supressor
VFHLQGIRWDKSQFLSKSLLGFVTFNIISYSLLLAEVITTTLAEPPPNDPGFYSHLFNGCYAVLLFINVIFFLIYGVEVFFKVSEFLCILCFFVEMATAHTMANNVTNF